MYLNNTRLSVIIPSYLQHELVVIHAQQCQSGTRIPDEIIIVNDGGPEDLLPMLKAVSWKTKVIYVRIDQNIPWNQQGASNLGAFISTGDILAFEDIDHIPDNNLYEECLRTFYIQPDIAYIRPTRIMCKKDEIELFLTNVKTPQRRNPGSSTKLIRRNVFLDIKGYNEDFSGHYGWDDGDCHRRLALGGWKFTRTQAVYLTILDGSTPDELLRNQGNNRAIYVKTLGQKQPQNGMIRFTYKLETVSLGTQKVEL